MFGGFNGVCSFNDIEVFEVDSTTWHQLKVLGTPPIARDAHAMVTSKNNLYLFGGHDGVRHLNDLHEFDSVAKTWTEIKYRDSLPSGLRGHSANCIGSSLYIFGGYDGKMRSNELICFDLKDKTWYMPVESSSSKSLTFMNGRQRHSTNTWNNGKIIIFGGFDGKNMLNDVYIIDISKLEENIIKSEVKKNHVNNFKKVLLNKPEFSDITIFVKNQKIYAHKAILASQCPKFYAQFTSEMPDGKTDKLTIGNFSYDAVFKMIEFFYCGEANFNEISHKCLLELLHLSDEYMVDNLHRICEKKLLNTIDVENVVQILILADNLNLTTLKQQCMEFMLKRISDIDLAKNSEEFIKNPTLLMEITKNIANQMNNSEVTY